MSKEDDICQAMRNAGITDADSQNGVDFCVNRCPHPHCIVFESGGELPRGNTARYSRLFLAKRMHADGYSAEEIARVLNKSIRTVQRYLR